MASPVTSTATLSATLFYGDAASYATAHNATDAQTKETGALYIGQNTIFDGLYYIRRGCIKFPIDLGADNGSATITGVVFHGYGAPGTQDDSAGDSITIVSFSPADTTNPAVADYDQLGTTAYATTKLISSFSIGADNTMSLNSTGIAAVQSAIGGTLWLGYRTLNDVNNTTPTHNPQVIIQDEGDAHPPTLVITYSLPAPASTGNFFLAL